jgi:hypothetical protein
MKFTAQMGSVAIITNYIKIGSGIQKYIGVIHGHISYTDSMISHRFTSGK